MQLPLPFALQVSRATSQALWQEMQGPLFGNDANAPNDIATPKTRALSAATLIRDDLNMF